MVRNELWADLQSKRETAMRVENNAATLEVNVYGYHVTITIERHNATAARFCRKLMQRVLFPATAS
jgi:hypothetical protein